MSESVARQDAAGFTDHLFRRESGRVIATLLRLVGDFDVAEEILQETLVTALEHWPSMGLPDNPGAWLTTVAQNRAIDHLRREKRRRVKAEALAREVDEEAALVAPADPEAIRDDRLRLLFTCCHPALPPEGRVALTLRLVGGLSTGEIARAFLSEEAAIAKRIVRAKQTIVDKKLPYAVPDRVDIPERLDSVLRVIYLIFNEGYTAREGPELCRLDLGGEALHLGATLVELMPDEPEALGLLALMELTTARNPARTDAEGQLVLLADQDRSRWDQARIRRGMELLARAEQLGAAGVYQLQAAITGCHSVAPTWAETDWHVIASRYAQLAAITASPVVELNRVVAVSMADGPEAGLRLLDALRKSPALAEYHLLPATRADLLRRLGRWTEAADEYRRALALTKNGPEQAFLTRRIAECEAGRG